MNGTVTIPLRDYENMVQTINAAKLKKGVIVYYFPDKIYYAATDNDIANDAMKEVAKYKRIAENAENKLTSLQARINEIKNSI